MQLLSIKGYPLTKVIAPFTTATVTSNQNTNSSIPATTAAAVRPIPVRLDTKAAIVLCSVGINATAILNKTNRPTIASISLSVIESNECVLAMTLFSFDALIIYLQN
jgi:hypothetical protein